MEGLDVEQAIAIIGQLPPAQQPIAMQQLQTQILIEQQRQQMVKQRREKMLNLGKKFGDMFGGASSAAEVSGMAGSAVGSNATGGYLFADGLGGASSIAPELTGAAGTPIGSAANGGTLIADGLGGSASSSTGSGMLGGAAAPLAVAALGYIGGKQAYNAGGRNILKGKGKSGDYGNMALYAAAPYLAVWDAALGAVGMDGIAPTVTKAVGLGQKSTKDYQDERWGALSPAAQELRAANHPENDDGIWDTGKYAGQKWSFDKALDLAKDDPTHFVGVLGNLETFGDDWLSTDINKQKEIVSRLTNEGLYHSNKGDVLIEDGKQDRAKQIFDEVRSSGASRDWNSIAAKPSMLSQSNVQQLAQSSIGQLDPAQAKPKESGSNKFTFRDSNSSSSSQSSSPTTSAAEDVIKQLESRYGSDVAKNYTPEGGTGGAGYEPDPNRPGHFRKRK